MRNSASRFAAAFAVACAFLAILGPTAPFTRELGVCESGAVRDVLAGNVILPRFIPGPYVHVPPLYWWIAALCVKALGWTELALRMPALVGAALTCAAIYVWACAVIGRRAAFWSAATLLTGHFFIDAARQPRMDTLLALFATVAALALERALAPANGRDPDTAGEPRSRHFAVAALAIGLGILAKGVLGIVLPAAAAGLYLLLRWRWRDIFSLGLIATFTVGLAIGLAWYVAGYAEGGRKFLDWQLEMNLWSRFIPTGAGGAGYCAHPFWYFAPHVLAGFMPWTLYLPAAAIMLAPARPRAMPEPIFYSLCWFAGIFIFFSSSQGKCLVYILPAFPPLAIIAGWTIDAALASAADDTRRERWTARAFTFANAPIALAAFAAAFALGFALWRGTVPMPRWHLHPGDRRALEIASTFAARRAPALIAVAIAFLTSGALLAIGLVRADLRRQALGMLVFAAVASFFWFGLIAPAQAEQETLKDFARAVAQALPPGAEAVHLGLSDCDLNFYSPAPLEPIYRLRCGPDTPRFVVARKADFMAAAPAARACYAPILESAPVDSAGPRVLLKLNAPPG
jgi:4-amino-4-deoxy-L-arabinose transferase-like glycosyltransferase